MRCKDCGAEYVSYHDCPGPSPERQAELLEPVPPLQFAPIRYFREGLAIALWNERAIRRAALDNNALLYGFVFWSIGMFLRILHEILLETLLNTEQGYSRVDVLSRISADFVGLFVAVALLTVMYFGLCHLLARWLFDASGTFLGILRPLMLGSIVTWLIIIPFVGDFLVRAWWGVAILLWVFEEVDGIERLQALYISVGLPVGIFLLILVLRTLFGV